MKKLSISMLLLAAIALTVPSCKKGENDPGLSLKSRAGRLAGEWLVSSYESTEKETDTGGDSETEVTTHSGPGNQVSKTTYSNSTDIDYDTITIVSHTLTFDKEGTFTLVFSTVETQPLFGVTRKIETTETTTGNWQFLGKSGDYKNKERIALTPTSAETKTTTTDTQTSDGSTDKETVTEVENISANSFAAIFDLIRLAGDEIIMESGSDNSYKVSSTNSTTTSTYKSSVVEKYTLTAAE